MQNNKMTTDGVVHCDKIFFKEKQIKIVVVGQENVGKTNLIRRFCQNEFSPFYVPTVGAEFYLKRLKNSNNEEILVRITDVSGVELNGQMLDKYFFKANIIILVYDITNKESFESCVNWLSKIDELLLLNRKDNNKKFDFILGLMGNKSDLEYKRTVNLDSIHCLDHNKNKLENFSVSARTGNNVNSSFMQIITKLSNLLLPQNEEFDEEIRIDNNNKIDFLISPSTSAKIQINTIKNNNNNIKKITKKLQSCKIQ